MTEASSGFFANIFVGDVDSGEKAMQGLSFALFCATASASNRMSSQILFILPAPPDRVAAVDWTSIVGWQCQGIRQGEAERRLRWNFDLLVSGRSTADQPRAGAYEGADAGSLTSSGDASNQRTPGCPATSGGCGPLA